MGAMGTADDNGVQRDPGDSPSDGETPGILRHIRSTSSSSWQVSSRPLSVLKAAESQPALLKFVEEVAELKHEVEPDDDGSPFEPTSEDTIATLNQLIPEARQLLGTADKCHKCGEVVPYVIGCPDGTELCQDCFNACED